MNTAKQVGGALGLAILFLVAAPSRPTVDSLADDYARAFLAIAAILVLVAAAALALPARTLAASPRWPVTLRSVFEMCNILDMKTPESLQNAVLVRAADAEVLSSDPGSVITLLADADETGGLLTSNRSLLRAGSDGAPPHFHERAAELFFVLAGSLQVLLGERVVTLEAGDLLVVPPRVPHAFAPAPGAEADVLFVFTPGKPRSDYYRLLDRVYAGDADAQEIVATQDRFDNHYVESAAWAAR
jgi:mannose-6-phosphate isomerase-like protein (cupin superfamily)